ncbi:unnamed protein product, partial [Rotaria socialis]
VHLNITADEPVLLANGKVSQTSLSYNYTALLTSALFQAKIDIEHLNDDQPLYLSSPLNPN